MPKKFTDTGKWSDKWFRNIKPSSKLLYLYLCDMCDLAGFYEMDWEDIEFRTKMDPKHFKPAYEELQPKLIVNGDHIWLKNHLKHQKNLPLNPENNAHKNILASIDEHLPLFPDIPKILGANKGLKSPIGKGKVKVEVKVIDNFEKIWDRYPKKKGKKEALKHFTASVKTDQDHTDIVKALFNYLTSKEVKDGYIQDGSTWFNDWEGWVNPTPQMMKGAEAPVKQKREELTFVVECDVCHNDFKTSGADKVCTSCGGTQT